MIGKIDNGTYTMQGSGWSDRGYGWISSQVPAWGYPTKSVVALLNEKGYLNSSEIADPLKPNNGGYMLYRCGDGSVALYATLEKPANEEITNFNSVSVDCTRGVNPDLSIAANDGVNEPADYGKNYVITNWSYSNS